MTHAQAAAALAGRGASVSRSITRNTTLVVIGADGLPLRGDGRPAAPIEIVDRLRRNGQAVEVISEEEFLGRLGVSDAPIVGRRTQLELIRLTGVSSARLRCWIDAGLVTAELSDGVPVFDLRQVQRVKSLAGLASAGIPLKTIRRSLVRLRRCLPEAQPTLDEFIGIAAEGRSVVFRTDEGVRIDPGGQMLLDFDQADDESSATISVTPRESEDTLFERAVACEESGDDRHAAAAYRQLLEQEGPDPDVCFNLANVLQRLGETAAAIERFRQTVEIDPSYGDAWRNLGIVLSHSGRHEAAVHALTRALELEPDDGDIHYNLADVLEDAGQFEAARKHWEAFLRYAPQGEWAEYARQRLGSA